jgi:hypothetical protein
MTIEAYESAYSISIFGSYRPATKEKKCMKRKRKKRTSIYRLYYKKSILDYKVILDNCQVLGNFMIGSDLSPSVSLAVRGRS